MENLKVIQTWFNSEGVLQPVMTLGCTRFALVVSSGYPVLWAKQPTTGAFPSLYLHQVCSLGHPPGQPNQPAMHVLFCCFVVVFLVQLPVDATRTWQSRLPGPPTSVESDWTRAQQCWRETRA
jgi:hypothetical protein